MPVQQIKHNNDGKFYHIAIDIAKEGAQLFDLTPYVKGRVGDNNFGLLVDWYRQGMLMNVNGAYKPIIDGLVGNFSFDKNGNLKMDDDASPVYSVGKPEDCGPAGQVTYYFPEQMFPKEGIFKGYLGLIDDKGNRYSGVDIWFSVLAGNARMGMACDFYISEFEKAIKETEDDLANHKKSMQQVVDEFVDKMNNLSNELTTQATTVNADLKALKNKIDQDHLFTQAEAEAFKQELEKRIDLLKRQYAHVYPDVASMQADTELSAGMYARTLGYYMQGDGGDIMYIISQSSNPYGISIANSLNAIPIIDSSVVNVLKLGIKNDGTQDCSETINKLTKNYALYFPAGKYLIADQLNIYHNIKGDGGSGYFSKDDIGLTTFVSAIECKSDSAQNTSESVICNHGVSTIIQDINLKLNTDENGITDNGYNVTRIKDIFIYELKTGCGVKIDRDGSRSSIIENLFIEASHDSVYDSIGLYYLTGTDELLSNFWSMGCKVGIHAVCCLFYGTNLHIWGGSVAKNINIDWWNGTNGLYLQSSFAYLTNLYCDTTRFSILTNSKSVASVKNIIVNFDDSIEPFSDKLSDIELSHSSDSDFIEFDGGTVYADRYSGVEFFNNYLKATVKNIMIQVDDKSKESYLDDHYRYLLPNMAWGYDKEYKVDLLNEVAGKYVEIARMPIMKTSAGDVKVFISDGHNGAVEVLIQVADGSIKADNLGSGNNLILAYKIINNWLILYAETLDGYNTFSITAEGSNTFSLINYKYLRRVNQQEFEKLRQDNDAGLTKLPFDGTWTK